MGVKWKTKVDNIPKVKANAETISGKKVKVGVFNGENSWLASIHEFGCTITPKNAQYLTVPVHPDAVGRKAGSFSDLFCIKSKKGNLLLVKQDGDSVIPYYWLTKSVKIPERSFLRSGHDENVDRIIKQTERALGQVLSGKMSVDDLCELYGIQMATAIKTYARNLSSPENSSITIANKGSYNPLVDTGGMIEGIDWKVEG